MVEFIISNLRVVVKCLHLINEGKIKSSTIKVSAQPRKTPPQGDVFSCFWTKNKTADFRVGGQATPLK